MRMNFEILEDSIIDNVLIPAEAGRYETVGGHGQRDSAARINENRKVMVFYNDGLFSESSGAAYDEVQHDVSFDIVLTEATAADADLSVLQDDTASEADKAAALRAMKLPSVKANRSMNRFIAIVYQILMDKRNDQLGIKPPDDRPRLKQVSKRWIESISKGDPVPEGEFVILTSAIRLTCRVPEQIIGDDLPAVQETDINVDMATDGDDTTETGVEITDTP